MNQVIKDDLYRYTGAKYSFIGFLKALRIEGFKYTFLLRKVALNRHGIFYYLWKLLLSYFGTKYGFQMDPFTKLGTGLYIGHFGTLIVNGNTIIGKNCNLSPGVTIGKDHRGIRKGTPMIGNDVWIGTNAVIVGKINIGDNVLIAPNTFVNMDIPSNSIVIGNPCKIINRENATDGYINNKV